MSTRTASLEEKLDLVTEELAVAKQEKDRLFRDFMNSKLVRACEGVCGMRAYGEIWVWHIVMRIHVGVAYKGVVVGVAYCKEVNVMMAAYHPGKKKD